MLAILGWERFLKRVNLLEDGLMLSLLEILEWVIIVCLQVLPLLGIKK